MSKRRSRTRRRTRGGRSARLGDVVTIDFSLTPEDGYIPHPLFDSSGTAVSFVLGWGNYLPGLHDLVEGMRPGESIKAVSIDAGWGRRDPALVAEVSKAKLADGGYGALKVGDELKLAGGTVRATVVRETEGTFVVDANPPLAGSSYSCYLRVLSVSPPPETRIHERKKGEDDDALALLVETSDEEEDEQENEEDDVDEGSPDNLSEDDCDLTEQFHVASFAVGCFWGGELAFMREPGVAGTRVGYTQGTTPCPTYEEVCEGSTGHREAVLVLYDPAVVSYERLAEIALERMDVNATSSTGIATLFEDPEEQESTQYRHEIYCYSKEQRHAAQQLLEKIGKRAQTVDILPASTFFLAEERHQNYLLKGGQSACKGSKETIRCFG